LTSKKKGGLLEPPFSERLAAWRAGGGTQKLGRAQNFQIITKLSASRHPA